MEQFRAEHGLRSARLRYFNAAGADPAAEIGKDHERETRLIPLAVTGCEVPVHISPARLGDPLILLGAAGKAQGILGWTPLRSELSTIVANAWAWHRRRFSSLCR